MEQYDKAAKAFIDAITYAEIQYLASKHYAIQVKFWNDPRKDVYV